MTITQQTAVLTVKMRLIVDDSRTVRHIARRILNDAGLQDNPEYLVAAIEAGAGVPQ